MKKNNIFTVMKKEFARFFGDRRMVLTTIVLPGLMIYLVYSLMGSAFGNMEDEANKTRAKIFVTNMPVSMQTQLETAGDITNVATDGIQAAKDGIAAKTTDILIVFPTNFDDAIAAYSPQSGTAAPNIEVFFNSSAPVSQKAYAIVNAVFDGYESAIANKFDINNTDAKYDLASDKDSAGQIFSSLFPMLILMFLFSGCMAIAPESIAGEKERGTIATLLVTPLKRSELAVGKVVSLSCLALLSGLSSFIGILLSLPKMMNFGDAGLSANVYGTSEYMLLILIILSTVLLFVGLISIISAFAKSVREAGGYVSPLMILVMLLGISTMFSTPDGNIFMYLIPVYNSAQCITSIFAFNYSVTNIIITAAANVVYTLICCFILTRMFNYEKVMFAR